MASGDLYLDLFAYVIDRPADVLETRIIALLEANATTESLDDATFDQINGSETKADYLLGQRRFVVELKTINASPLDRTEQRLKARLAQADAPIVFGTVGVSKVIEGLADQEALAKMMVDMAGRAVRRHLQKANAQIGAIKERLDLPQAAGLLILMNDSEEMIDAAAIGYTLKTAFEMVPGGYPHLTNVLAFIESHRIALPGGRTGFPVLHVYRSRERRLDLDFLASLLGAWASGHATRIELVDHRGDWESMRAIYDGAPPTFSPFE